MRKLFFTYIGGGLGIVGLLLAAKFLWGPGLAVAQSPNKRATPGSSAPAKSTPTSPTGRTPFSKAPAASGTPQVANNSAAPAATDIVGSVNGQPITRNELARECLRRYGNDVLENLVNRQLISQACQSRKVIITDQDVEAEIDSIARKFNLTKERWAELLQDERSVSPDQYRREIIWPTLALRRLAAEELVVSQEDLRNAFESEYGPSVKVRVISLNNRQDADRIRAKAASSPDTFGELAKEHSKDQSASARGLISPIRKHAGDPKLEAIAFRLKKGEISPVVEVANQFLIIKCEDQLPEKIVDGKQLVQVQNQLRERIRDEKLRNAASNLFKQMQDESKVVNVFNDAKLQAQHPGVAALINGRPVMLAVLEDECINRHGGDVLDGEINRLILSQELQRLGKNVTEQDVDAEIARAAEAYGYTKDGAADVDGWLEAVTADEKVTVDLYIRDAVWPSVALKKLVDDKVKVTEDDLQKGFESNYGERVEVMAIVFSNQRQAQTVWEMARNNPSDQFFGELAQQYSVEAMSKSNSGRVPPIRKHGGQPVIEEEAFRLKPGELSGIIALTDKYVILRCLGRTKPVVTKFATVKNELADDIHEKKLRIEMANAFDSLKEAARVENRLTGSVKTSVRAANSRASVSSAAPNSAGKVGSPSSSGKSGLQPASATQSVGNARNKSAGPVPSTATGSKGQETKGAAPTRR